MLSLTRKPEQFIQIGDDIRIYFYDFNRGQIRVGIEAPRHINIVRGELLESWRDEDDRSN